jgi:hypothetical protein
MFFQQPNPNFEKNAPIFGLKTWVFHAKAHFEVKKHGFDTFRLVLGHF